MSRIIRAVLLLLAAQAAFAQVSLNTGYNNGSFSTYPINAQDQYWIAITSYPNSPTAPSHTILKNSGWSAPFPQTQWISAWTSWASPPNTSVQNPAYTVFRKCFCLMPGFKDPKMSFQLRVDDNVEVWFNTVLNVLVPSQVGNFWNGATAISVASVNPALFRSGKNCLYVLAEDTGGAMGFDMMGSVQAQGLLPLAAAGVDQTIPCCTFHPLPDNTSTSTTAPLARIESDNDDRVLQQIREIAEQRRKTHAPRRPPVK